MMNLKINKFKEFYMIFKIDHTDSALLNSTIIKV